MPITIVPTAPFPDAEAVVIDYLLSVDALTALVDDRIGSNKPDGDVYPCVRATRPSSFPAVAKRLDKPTIQIDTWADTDEAAFEVASIAYAALVDMPETSDDARAIVTEVVPQVGVRQLPDVQTEHPRYEFEVGVYIHTRS